MIETIIKRISPWVIVFAYFLIAVTVAAQFF